LATIFADVFIGLANTWADEATAKKLAGLFTNNFKQYEKQVTTDLLQVGPHA
jgi:hypothetical protein